MSQAAMTEEQKRDFARLARQFEQREGLSRIEAEEAAYIEMGLSPGDRIEVDQDQKDARKR